LRLTFYAEFNNFSVWWRYFALFRIQRRQSRLVRFVNRSI